MKIQTHQHSGHRSFSREGEIDPSSTSRHHRHADVVPGGAAKDRSASRRVERRALMPKPRTQPCSRVAWRRSRGRARIAEVADLGRGRG